MNQVIFAYSVVSGFNKTYRYDNRIFIMRGDHQVSWIELPKDSSDQSINKFEFKLSHQKEGLEMVCQTAFKDALYCLSKKGTLLKYSLPDLKRIRSVEIPYKIGYQEPFIRASSKRLILAYTVQMSGDKVYTHIIVKLYDSQTLRLLDNIMLWADSLDYIHRDESRKTSSFDNLYVNLDDKRFNKKDFKNYLDTDETLITKNKKVDNSDYDPFYDHNVIDYEEEERLQWVEGPRCPCNPIKDILIKKMKGGQEVVYLVHKYYKVHLVGIQKDKLFSLKPLKFIDGRLWLS